jgi:hypothetical protein
MQAQLVVITEEIASLHPSEMASRKMGIDEKRIAGMLRFAMVILQTPALMRVLRRCGEMQRG